MIVSGQEPFPALLAFARRAGIESEPLITSGRLMRISLNSPLAHSKLILV